MSQAKEPTAKQIADEKLYHQMGLTDSEYAKITELLGRLPNYTEVGLFGVMWSEHCSYKHSKSMLKHFPTSGPHVLQGPGEGAGVVDIGDGQAVVFKMESHNHPSAIEPFQGAATGVGGILRDVFSMGARPIALLNSLRFGELTSPKNRYLFERVVAGIAHYGNCVGVPTVGGEVYFDPCYEGNPLVNAMCVGIIDHKDIKKGRAEGVGSSVLYVGASTGRDGIHGATFASEELSESSEAKRPAVQVGDPFTEKLLLEACLELLQCEAVLGIQDMGAAGLISSSSEMASKAGNGIELNLDLVPQREADMTPYEMMLSESQERMLLVVKPDSEAQIAQVCRKWGLNCVKIGAVTADKQLKLFHRRNLVADLPVDYLASKAPVYEPEYRIPQYYLAQKEQQVDLAVSNHREILLKLLATPTIASKEWVYSQYDHMVRTSTVVMPGSDGAVVRIRGTRKALAFSVDCNSRYLYLDPLIGGRIALAEVTRNLVCAGAKPLAITDCLNFGSPENPENYWQFVQAIHGISEGCKQLKTPVVSGNVSFYNERNGQAIYPSPILGAVGLISDVDHITTQEFQTSGDKIILLGTTNSEFGGSQLQKVLTNENYGAPPALDWQQEIALQTCLTQLIQDGKLASAHDLSEGGLGVALAECTIQSDLGCVVSLDDLQDATTWLFSESQSRAVITVADEHVTSCLNTAAELGISAQVIGEVTHNKTLRIDTPDCQLSVPLDELRATYQEVIPCLMQS